MSLPELSANGDLPPGIHQATLTEVLRRFGETSAQRILIAQRLKHIYHVAITTNQLARFVIFGSFITSKREPNDVDVFMIMEDTFDIAACHGKTRTLFEHQSAQDHYGASVFWLRRCAAMSGEQVTLSHWQIKRDGGRRGIVEIIGEQP